MHNNCFDLIKEGNQDKGIRPTWGRISEQSLNATWVKSSRWSSRFTVAMCPPGGEAPRSLDRNHPPRFSSYHELNQTREDGGYWPFPVRSCQTATAGSATAMAGFGNGSDGMGDPVSSECPPTGESSLRAGRRVYGRLLCRGSGGGGSAAPAGSWHQPRQHRRTDSASSGWKVDSQSEPFATVCFVLISC